MVFNAVDKTAFWILVGFFQVGYWIGFGFSAFRLRICWFLSFRYWIHLGFSAFRPGFGWFSSVGYWIGFGFSPFGFLDLDRFFRSDTGFVFGFHRDNIFCSICQRKEKLTDTGFSVFLTGYECLRLSGILG